MDRIYNFYCGFNKPKVMKALEILHNAPRIYGKNDLITVLNNVNFSFQNQLVLEYLVGISTSGIIFFITFFLLILNLCTIRSFFAILENQSRISWWLFLFFSLVSFVIWGFLFGSLNNLYNLDTSLIELINDSKSIVEKSFAELNSLYDTFSKIENITSGFLNISTSAPTFTPSANITTIGPTPTPTLNNITNATRNILENTNVLDDMKNLAENTLDQTFTQLNFIESSSNYFSVGRAIFVFLISILFFFCMSTILSSVFRVYFNVVTGNKCLVTTAMLFGTVLTIIIAIVSTILAAFASIGSDICIPDIDASIRKFFSAFTQEQFCLDVPWKYFCHYQTCLGKNELLIEVNFSTYIEQIESGLDFLEQVDPDKTQLIMEQVEIAYGHADNFLDLLDCKNSINPLYRKLVDEFICETVFNETASLFYTINFSIVAFIIILICYRLINFSQLKGYRLIK